MSDEISLRELISTKHLSEDHYPIKRVVFFLFSPDAKTIEKSVKYAIMELVAEQTKLNQKRQRSLDLPRL